MVQTRSMSKKQQTESPPQQKPPKKKVQPLATKRISELNLPNDMGQQPSKPATASEFPKSHPISVPPSPAGAPAEQNPLEFAQQLQEACEAARPPPAGEKLLPKPSERHVGAGKKLPDGPEPVQIDVEYTPREQLQPVEDPAAALEACTAGLEVSDWVEAIKSLNLLRQLAVHHAACCQPQLEKLIVGVLKSVRSLRSSLCKTAIMAVTDLYISFGDALLPLSDVGGQAKPLTSVLAQILLKCSSNDKKFVIEEAQRALETVAQSTTPQQLLPLLLPYVEHKNPKVRGKAGGAVVLVVTRMQPLEVVGFGMPRLLQLSGKLITDNTPEAREAAKALVGLLSAAFADEAVQQQLDVQVPEPEPAADGEEPAPKPSKWEHYCRQSLSTSAALAVLKAAS